MKKHLSRFGRDRLEQSGKRLPNGTRSRKKTGHAWFEIQDTCAYHEDFMKEKLLWIELVNEGRFAYDNSALYGDTTAFLLTGECIKYLCAVMNSKLIRWFLRNVAPTSGTGTLRWKKVYVQRLPIPRISPSEQRLFIRAIDCILQVKSEDYHADISETEDEIDRAVYSLFGLSAAEISLVEDRH